MRRDCRYCVAFSERGLLIIKKEAFQLNGQKIYIELSGSVIILEKTTNGKHKICLRIIPTSLLRMTYAHKNSFYTHSK